MRTEVTLSLGDGLKYIKEQYNNNYIFGEDIEISTSLDDEFIQLCISTNDKFQIMSDEKLVSYSEILLGLSKFEAKSLGKFLITIADEKP